MRTWVFGVLACGAVACGDGAKPAQAPSDPVVGEEEPAPTARDSEEITKGKALLEKGDTAGAKAAFEAAVAKDGSSAPAHYYLAVALEKSGDAAGAKGAYQKALALDGKLEEAAVNLSALDLDGKQFDAALAVARKGLAAHPKSASLKLHEGLALLGSGKTAEATAALEGAGQLAAKDPMVLLSVGQALGQAKVRDKGIAALEAAAAAAGDNVGVLASAGFELKGLGAFAQCTRILDKAVGLKDAAELRTYRALCKLGQKDDAGARADLEAAVKNEPKFAPAHFYLAGRFASEKKWAEAEKAYRRYLELEPSGPLAAVAKKRADLAKAQAKKGGGKKKR